MDIDKAINIFADFLSLTWFLVDPLTTNREYTSDENSKKDWIQANWEILVERKILPLNNHLEVYGEGADFNGSSSRITDIDSLPTFSIDVIVKNAKDILNNQEIRNKKYTFDRLVGFTKGFYVETPPFKYVLVLDEDKETERVFFIKNVKFNLHKLQLLHN